MDPETFIKRFQNAMSGYMLTLSHRITTPPKIPILRTNFKVWHTSRWKGKTNNISLIQYYFCILYLKRKWLYFTCNISWNDYSNPCLHGLITELKTMMMMMAITDSGVKGYKRVKVNTLFVFIHSPKNIKNRIRLYCL